jgi:ketosteroid isomerase-like protein
MQIRCRCGANLVVDPGTTTIVCAACQATVAVPQPEREFALSETVPAFQAQPAPAAAPRKRSSWPLVVGALAVVGAGVALVVVATREDTKPAVTTPVPVVVAPDAAKPEPPPAPASSPEELVVLERTAIARADEAALTTLLAPNAFVHGVDQADIAYTNKTGAPLVRAIGGAVVSSTWSKITRERDAAWIVDELEVGGVKLMTSQLAVRDGAVWRIAAWHIARLVPNKVAYQHARSGRLPRPDPVVDQPDDDHQVHDAFKAAFATREAFIAAFSDRADAIDLGSAPGERIVGGAAVKRAFSNIKATFSPHPEVTAGRAGDRIGWAAGNVDFSMTIEGELVTQTFRVLAVLVRERDGWRIVLAQWSNAGPIP